MIYFPFGSNIIIAFDEVKLHHGLFCSGDEDGSRRITVIEQYSGCGNSLNIKWEV